MAGKGKRFTFRVPLVKLRGVYVLEAPERVSAALGKRGPVPIVAMLNGRVELQASLAPMGGGRHWLQLNTRVREELGVEVGDVVRVALEAPERAPVMAMPEELMEALREADVLEAFAGLPVGKQNHIILWIAEASRAETRAKRVAMAVQVAMRARERAYDRERRLGG